MSTTVDVAEWMSKVPWVSFRSSSNEKIVHGISKKMFGPTFLRASFEIDSQVVDSTTECWVIEWIEGQHRHCRIKSLTPSSSTGGQYWRMVKLPGKSKKDFLYDVLVEDFPNTDDDGPMIQVGEKIIRPSIFYLAIIDSNIAFQLVTSKLWLSLHSNNGQLTGIETFNDSCLFELAIKFALSSKYNSRRYYLGTKVIGKYLSLDGWWVSRRQAFFMIFKKNYIIILAAGTGRYWNLDIIKKRLNTVDSPARFQLVGGDPYWKILVNLHTIGKDDGNPNREPDYQELVYYDNGIYVAADLVHTDLSSCADYSNFELSLLPSENNRNMKISQTDVKEEQIKGIFGTDLEDIPCEFCNLSGVPFFIEDAIEFMIPHIKSEGLFRISGRNDIIKELKVIIDSGMRLKDAINSIEDRGGPKITVDDIAGVFKSFFRELPTPLFSDSVVKLLTNEPSDNTLVKIKCGNNTFSLNRDRQILIKSTINRKIPRVNRIILDMLFKFLNEVSQQSSINKMTSSNIALVFGPNLASAEATLNPVWKEIVEIMIEAYSYTFGIKSL